jgi:hypothetical protein
MKSKNDLFPRDKKSRIERPVRFRAVRLALADFNFHPTGDPPFRGYDSGTGGNASRHESFRAITQRFLQREARQEFVLEALSFLIITLIAAWPLAAILETLIQRTL